MKVEYVSPFVTGAVKVAEQLFGIIPERGQLSARPEVFTTEQLNVVCGITGPVEGQVIYGMRMDTAHRIASLMIGQEVTEFDALAASAIAELGNMICGSSMQNLSQAGFICDITPPTIIRGTNVRITSLDIPTLVVPIILKDVGTIEINLSLHERRRLGVAV